jgi:hypothetical protein
MTKRTRPWRMSNLACVELLALKIYSLGRIPCGFSPTGCNFALLPKGGCCPSRRPADPGGSRGARSVGRSGPSRYVPQEELKRGGDFGGLEVPPLADVPAQAPRRTRMRTRAGPLARGRASRARDHSQGTIPRPRPPRSSAVASGGGGAWRAGARGRCRLKRAGRRKAGCAIMAAGWFLASSWLGLGRIFAANYSVGASVGWSVEEIS